MEDIAIKCILTEIVHIKINKVKNIKDTLLSILKNKIGNKCIKDGFVIENSIEIIKYSIGEIIADHFTGEVRYKVLYTAFVYNPPENSEITCTVKNKNKMGILAEAGFINENIPSPLSILLSKQHHINNDLFNNVYVGDIITIKVVGKRFELYEQQIFIIGKLINIGNLLQSGGNNIMVVSKNNESDDINIWINHYINGKNYKSDELSGKDPTKHKLFLNTIENLEKIDPNWFDSDDNYKINKIIKQYKENISIENNKLEEIGESETFNSISAPIFRNKSIVNKSLREIEKSESDDDYYQENGDLYDINDCDYMSDSDGEDPLKNLTKKKIILNGSIY